VKASTSTLTATNEKGIGYGYQWWTLPPVGTASRGAFLAWGYGGQLLIVVPELDLIAVFTGWNIYDKKELDPRLAFERVVAAVEMKQ
jgi:CubicO group peptidase (beta-lactamase class C family)